MLAFVEEWIEEGASEVDIIRYRCKYDRGLHIGLTKPDQVNWCDLCRMGKKFRRHLRDGMNG